MDTKKIKVLLVSNTLSCGGAERQIVHMANALNKSGAYDADVLYYANEGGDFVNDLTRAPLYVDKEINGSLKFIRILAGILKRGEYDVVHAAGGSANIYARAAGILAHTKAIFGNMRGKRHFKGRNARIVNSFLNLFAKDWIVNNPDLIPILMRDLRHVRRERVYLLLNSYEPASAVDYRKDEVTEYDADRNGAFVFGTVGRFARIKNYPMFLRAAARISEKHENVRFWMIGDGDEMENCRELAAALGIADLVTFWGFRTDTDVAMSRMDVYVQCSDSEGTPNTVLEAMRASRPILMTRSTDLSLIMEEGENGYTLPVGDEDALVAGMERLLASSPEEREKMGAHSSRLFEKSFLEESAVCAWDRVYRQVLEGKR